MFGEKLKQLRVKNDYSQESLAQLINVSRSAIAKWENNGGMPDIDNLIAISDLFDVTIDSLVRDEEVLETNDQAFCFRIAFASGVVGMISGFIFKPMNMFFSMIGFGMIAYALTYIYLQFKKRKN